jgi:Holliday junction resolvase RusA-like endonuclease
VTVLVDVEVPGPPQGKGRPRVTKTGHVYTPAPTRAAEKQLGLELLAARQARARAGEDVSVRLHFYVASFRRMDLDNFVKLALDAATPTLWDDDSQVTGIGATIVRGSSRPRTEFKAWTR